MRDLNIPHWLLALLISLAIVAFTAFAVFALIITLTKAGNGGACKSSSDCRHDLGSLCNNYRCSCAYSHFWSDTYGICERRRMVNRTCVNDSQCDVLAELQCVNVTLSSGHSSALQCQCITGTHWYRACIPQQLYQGACSSDPDCDSSRFLYCNTSNGQCLCNSSIFRNSVNGSSGTCEYKRTINESCLPYDNSWCDNTSPVGQGLICANYTNPYGSEYGTCQCPPTQVYNGNASLVNAYCVNQSQYNGSCASPLKCDYRVNLVCSNGTCTCASGNYYDSTSTIGGGISYCVKASVYTQNCSASLPCSTSQSLFCDYTYYNLSSVGLCNCNASWSYWNGLTCASKLSIGGECTNNTQCISAYGLFCSNYTPTMNQCDCDKNHYWNDTCITKLLYNESCASNYECDDNRGLRCNNSTGNLSGICNCYNDSYIWDSLYTNRSQTFILKLSNNVIGCYGPLECQDYNDLICANGTCECNYTDYWNSSRCQPKKNYTVPCNSTYECQNYPSVGLICGIFLQNPPCNGTCSVCPTGQLWDTCFFKCTFPKQRHEACTLPGGKCTSIQCDITHNLQCINDSVNNQTGGSGWCNCTSLQWWNGTYCREKGIPAWGTNTSALCNATYQCADYNLVSCPLGGYWPMIQSTCECATTKYWNGVTCLDRVVVNQPCTSWGSPVSTSTCLSAAGAGLNCTSSNCNGTTCTGGTCQCPSGRSWNSTFLICV